MFALSARSAPSLRAQAKKLADHLATLATNGSAIRLDDLCHTFSFRRQHFDHRLAGQLSDATQLITDLAKTASGETPASLSLSAGVRPKVAMMFTGQGSQYAGMGKRLYETEPVFRAVLDECNELLEPVLKCSLLDDILFADGKLLNQTQFTQPALFAFEFALARLYMSWGLVPDVVMGHSLGEYVAACVAGVFTLADGLKLVATRAQLMGNVQAGGVMVAVFASADVVKPKLAGYESEVSIAAINGPQLVVVSGAPGAVDEIVKSLTATGVRSKPLEVSDAFHSPLMEPMLMMFEMVANMANFSEPKIAFVSNVTGEVVRPGTVTSGQYWKDHVRAAVNFRAGIEALEDFGASVFVEIGPNPTLVGMGKRCLSPDSNVVFVPTVKRGQDDSLCVQQTLNPLFALGTPIQLGMATKKSDEGEGGRPPQVVQGLPGYVFDAHRHWIN